MKASLVRAIIISVGAAPQLPDGFWGWRLWDLRFLPPLPSNLLVPEVLALAGAAPVPSLCCWLQNIALHPMAWSCLYNEDQCGCSSLNFILGEKL